MLANSKIFKAYDVRGEWGKDWDAAFVYRIGLAVASSLSPKIVAIGRDMRASSDIIFEQLCSALTASGVHVIDLGLCGTELTYFASSFLENVDATIMITASHNLGKDNGLKITKKGSFALGLDSGLSAIRDLALSDQHFDVADVKGVVSTVDVWEKYKEHVFSLASVDLSSLSGKKVVVDAGNGMGGYQVDKVLHDLPLEVVRMYWEPNGSFPNHLADPFQERNVEDLKKKVIAEGALLGISLDGDGDRIFFVDDKGRYISGYYFAALMTRYMLKRFSTTGEKIVHDPRYFWATCEAIKEFDAVPIKSDVGHTLIKAAMRENNSLFSAECSGHVFYRSNNFAESTMLTILYVLQFIVDEGLLSSAVDYYFENYPISGEINFIVEDKDAVLKKLEGMYSSGTVVWDDGLSVALSDWRFNIRPSNTQPLLRLNVEAKDRDLISAKVAELKEAIGGEVADH